MGGASGVSLLFLLTGALWPLGRAVGAPMCLTGNGKEWLRESARPPKGKAPKPLWGVCGRGGGGAAGETGSLDHILLMTGPEVPWQVG